MYFISSSFAVDYTEPRCISVMFSASQVPRRVDGNYLDVTRS